MVNATITALFHRSPLWVQDAALSAYGCRLRVARYGTGYREAKAQLDASDRFDSVELNRLQTHLLRDTITNAVRNVPFYRQRFSITEAQISRLQIEDLPRAFPLLPKQTVRTNADEFRSDLVRGWMVVQTSGSTGSPLLVSTTKTAIRRNYAFFARFLGWHGVSPFDESATFAGRMFVGPSGGNQRQWRRNAAMHDTLFSSYHLTEENIPAYVMELARRQPRYIDAYPSSIHRVASYLDNHGINHGIRPKVIVTSSETLLEPQRQTITRVFACPVRDQYGSAEMAGFIAECDRGRYHAASEYGVVEVVDARGEPVPPGEIGELCLTGFINPAMPLIRYLIGDAARVSTVGCDCGRAGLVIESIEGRMDDVILTPSGRHVGRLDPAFKGVRGVRESQILQTALDRIVVKIVTDETRDFDPNGLVENLTERLGPDVKIALEYVDTIPKESNGKFRSVKSLLRRTSG